MLQRQAIPIIKVQLLRGAKLPTKAYLGDAGWDLHAFTQGVIKANAGVVTKIPIGIKLELPAGTYASVENKSSVGSRGVITMAGIIDEGYRGELSVLMMNLSGEDFHFVKGQKIAQLIVHPYRYYAIEEVTSLSSSERGTRGFGSSGKL